MGIENLASTPVKNLCDDAKNDARLNVLYSPFRKKEVNPQDWDSKMTFWKNSISEWCQKCNCCVFTMSKLQSSFVRNGRPASCLATVIDDMLRNNEVVHLQDILGKDPSGQTWSTWAVNSFVKAPIIWSFTKLKDSLITKPECDVNAEFVHISVLKKHLELLKDKLRERNTKSLMKLEDVKSLLGFSDDSSFKVALHWLQLEHLAVVRTVGGVTVVKLSDGGRRVSTISDVDVGMLQLRQNEQALTRMLEQLEEEKKTAEQEARNYIHKGMRQAAKSCLRKKKELEKSIDKRASALENIQVLLARVKEAESDGEILDSYKLGLSALKTTFKDAGLSEDGVCHTMDQVKEVLEVHDEIQSALSEPVADSVDKDLEEELAELLAADTEESLPDTHGQSLLPDLPSPPSHSPSSASTRTTTTRNREAQSIYS